MKILSRMIMMAAFLGLAGCSGLGGTFVAEPFMNTSITGSDFNAELAKTYQGLVKHSVDTEGNWYDSGLYALKGRAAMNGETPQPWEPSAFGLTDPKYDSARTELLSAIDSHKKARPMECAMVQGAYDQWLDEAAEGVHCGPTPEEAEENFRDWLAKCIGSSAPPAVVSPAQRFIIYFGFDRDDLTAEARQVVSNILTAVGGSGRSVDLAGHADRAGPSDYNVGLANRRVRTVTNALTGGDISGGQISGQGFGESQNAIPTADGVPEQLNRRVEINIGN